MHSQEIDLLDLPENSYFLMPWRSIGNHGRLLSLGKGSARIHVPLVDGKGWERTNVSLHTSVVPATEHDFRHQPMDEQLRARSHYNRSDTESPVKLVHATCEEMRGSPRNDIIAECVARGVNINTAKTQYYHWRKKNGGSK